jgi:hypothetical protein
MEICERSIQIIKTLGVESSTVTAVAAAFYDPAFDPARAGEKERLLAIGDNLAESAIARRRRRAKRVSQRVSYSELLETKHCPPFEQLVAVVARGLSGIGLITWLAAWIETKKSGREIPPHYLLTNQELSKKKKTRK